MKPRAWRLVERVALVVGGEVEVVQAESLRRPVTVALPPCRIIRISPLTARCASSMNVSRARFSGEYHWPS